MQCQTSGDEENNVNNLIPDPNDLPDPDDHNNSNNVDNPIPDSDDHNNSDNNSTTEIPDEVIQQEEDMREEELAENIRINNEVGEGTQRGRGIINQQLEQADQDGPRIVAPTITGQLDNETNRAEQQDKDLQLKKVKSWVTRRKPPDKKSERGNLEQELIKYIDIFPQLKLRPEGVEASRQTMYRILPGG